MCHVFLFACTMECGSHLLFFDRDLRTHPDLDFMWKKVKNVDTSTKVTLTEAGWKECAPK